MTSPAPGTGAARSRCFLDDDRAQTPPCRCAPAPGSRVPTCADVGRTSPSGAARTPPSSKGPACVNRGARIKLSDMPVCETKGSCEESDTARRARTPTFIPVVDAFLPLSFRNAQLPAPSQQRAPFSEGALVPGVGFWIAGSACLPRAGSSRTVPGLPGPAPDVPSATGCSRCRHSLVLGT